MRAKELPIIVIGGGGHAKVLVSTLLLRRQNILGFTDRNAGTSTLFGIKCLGDDEIVLSYSRQSVQLVNGIGSIASIGKRKEICEHFMRELYSFASVLHPSAIIAADVQLEEGIQIMAGTVVQAGCRLGPGAIVNTGARIDHDCIIDAFAHIAPGATLCGAVEVGRDSHVGAGATVIQGIRIGAGSVIGAGAVVIRDVPPGAKVMGVPARPVSQGRTS